MLELGLWLGWSWWVVDRLDLRALNLATLALEMMFAPRGTERIAWLIASVAPRTKTISLLDEALTKRATLFRASS